MADPVLPACHCRQKRCAVRDEGASLFEKRDPYRAHLFSKSHTS
uniref:Uncharacterized protein n=1 Tax=Sphingomonas sp. JE1 TaxID=1628059 RepID=A0A0D4ZZ49_9SPHN|nr:hypothetical protein pJE1_007 [Sphingomonas sp. JE1]